MSRISVTADRFRRAILAHEEGAASAMVQTYGSSYQLLSEELDRLTAAIIALQEGGKTVTRDMLYRRTRLTNLLQMVENEVKNFNQYADAHIALEQAYAIEQAQEHSLALIRTAIGTVPQADAWRIPQNFLKFNPAVVETFIGRSYNGSPLRELFETFAGEQVQAVNNIFVKGIIRGENPRATAAALAKEFQVPLTRAMTISRTEVLNAYRETNRQGYVQNAHVVERWRWQCAFNSRTCAMCIAMDGREFDTAVQLGTHPNCRCAIVPVTKSWAELGFEGIPDRRSRPQLTGAEWFGKQPAETQLAILGPGKYERFKEGNLTLEELVGYRRSHDWGETRWERSLRQIDAGESVSPRKALGILPREASSS